MSGAATTAENPHFPSFQPLLLDLPHTSITNELGYITYVRDDSVVVTDLITCCSDPHWSWKNN